MTYLGDMCILNLFLSTINEIKTLPYINPLLAVSTTAKIIVQFIHTKILSFSRDNAE